MALEIERKFLLANDDWKGEVIKSEHLRDGLIARFGQGKVRVRLARSNAWLTIKGPREGISRPEFEYEIPRADAEDMLRTLCQGDPVLEKVRHTVPFGGLDWTIDAYMGRLNGVVLAEVELEHPDQQPPLPPWVGEEVTNDPRFEKGALARRAKWVTSLELSGRTVRDGA
jgi:CYTH domain-containing protein